jgi:polyhydroxyalkanoate synthesis regulator phasin
MTANIEAVQDKKLAEKVVEFGKDGFYLGLGVVDVVQENVQELVKRGKNYRHNLIERGEKMADENRGRVNELVEKPQTMAKDTVKKAGETFDKYSEEVLTRIHVPTTDQIDTMNKKVMSVDKKLDKVIKETAAAERI